MRKYLLIAAGVVALGAIMAQTNYHSFNSAWNNWIGRVPASATNLCQGDCYVVTAIVSSGGSSGTITITDGSAQCGGGGCNLVNAVAIAANTTYAIPLNGVFSPGGVIVSGTGTLDLHFGWSTQPPAGWVR